MYAIIKTGGKQYTVRENDVVEVEKLEAAEGDKVELDSVLFISTESGPVVGAPVVEGAKVTAKVLHQGKGRKVIGFTYKPKKNIQRHYGHRQPLTRLQIEKIDYAA